MDRWFLIGNNTTSWLHIANWNLLLRLGRSILVNQSLFNIGSGKMDISTFVTYVGLVHFQGSTRNEMLTRNEILLNPILTFVSEISISFLV